MRTLVDRAWLNSQAVHWKMTQHFLLCKFDLMEALLAQEQDDMLALVKKQKLSEQTLLQKLTDYVERIDTDLVSGFHLPDSQVEVRCF